MATTPPDPAASSPQREMAHHRSVFSISIALLTAALVVTLVVLLAPLWGGPKPDDQLVAALVTAWVVGPVGYVGGFWLGSSVGGRSK